MQLEILEQLHQWIRVKSQLVNYIRSLQSETRCLKYIFPCIVLDNYIIYIHIHQIFPHVYEYKGVYGCTMLYHWTVLRPGCDSY